MFYVDSDGTRLKGDIFSVGSGSTFAYGILDNYYHHDLELSDAKELGRRAIYHAAHRDAYSGGSINRTFTFTFTSDMTCSLLRQSQRMGILRQL